LSFKLRTLFAIFALDCEAGLAYFAILPKNFLEHQ
jgi:hypothetical protein